LGAKRLTGPRGLAGLRALLRLGDESAALATYVQLQEEYGDLVGLSAGSTAVVLSYRPELAREIFKTRRDAYGRGGSLRREAAPLFRNSLLLRDDPERQRDRGDLAAALNSPGIDAFTPAGAVHKLVGSMLDRWESEAARKGEAGIEITGDLWTLTFAISGQALLGLDISAIERSINKDLHAYLKYTVGRASLPLTLPRWAPTPMQRRARRFTRNVHAAVDELLARALRGECEASPISNLIEIHGHGAAAKAKLHEHLLTLLLASHETVYAMLCWTLHLLSQESDLQDELRDEIRASAGATRQALEPPLVDRILLESLRLFPPAPSIVRVALRDDVLDGYRIPKHTVLFYPVYVTQRDPRYFNAPNEFQPDRFAKGAERAPDFAYFPFARGGARACVGERFAMQEGRFVVSRIAERFSFAPAPGSHVRPRAGMNLTPDGGIRLRIAAR
jgi:cytochrome P450